MWSAALYCQLEDFENLNEIRSEDTLKVVSMIPIKLYSERVKNKNLRKFYDGIPLMSLIQSALLESSLVNEAYVYCSDIAVKEYVLEGIHFLKRPKYLDSDSSNCNDIIREFIKAVDADVYVVCHATAPFTKPGSIDRCVRAVIEDNGYDSAFTVERLQTFIWSDGHPINFDPDCFPRTQDLEPLFLETSGAFAFPKWVFEKYNRRVGINPCLVEVSPVEGCDIDTEFDMTVAQAIYSQLKEGAHYSGCDD